MSALAILASLSACSLFRGPPPETFDLSGPESVKVAGSTAAQILIPEPIALKALDSDRIVVSKGAQISYYPDAQWPDRLPKLFQAKAIEAFERSKKARAVGRPGEGLSIDYQVVTEIRSFEYRADSAHGGTAHIEIAAKVMDDRNGRVVANHVFKGDAPVDEDKAPAVVDGLNTALTKVLVDLVRWTVNLI
jgi:cholesterol transport system auxiliary component